jgi:hypothetical protein
MDFPDVRLLNALLPSQKEKLVGCCGSERRRRRKKDQQSDSIIMQINVVAVYYTSFAIYGNSYSFPTSDTHRYTKGNPGRKVFSSSSSSFPI